MQVPNLWIVFIVLGVLAGIVSGLLGIGSGSIIVPALVLFLSFGQKNAQGTALAVMVPMALLGAFQYWRNPAININGAVVALIVCGALVGVLIGTGLVSRLPGHVLRKFFAIFLFIVAVRMFIGNSTSKQQPSKPDSAEKITVMEVDGENNEQLERQ